MEAAYQIYKAEPKYIHRPFINDKSIIEHLKVIVEKVSEVSFEKFNTKTRKQEIVNARQLFQYLVYKYTSLSSTEVGALFLVGFNHSTILSSKAKMEDIICLGNKDSYFSTVEKAEKEIARLTTTKKAN